MVKDETQLHLTSGCQRGNNIKHEKSIGERLGGAHAGGSVSVEKPNGSAANDKIKKTRGEAPFTKQEREEMETLLQETCGHLGKCSRVSSRFECSQSRSPVVYPTRFLEGEDIAKNFLFNTDRLLPLPIYN